MLTFLYFLILTSHFSFPSSSCRAVLLAMP
jgi:hypothetical protein